MFTFETFPFLGNDRGKHFMFMVAFRAGYNRIVPNAVAELVVFYHIITPITS